MKKFAKLSSVLLGVVLALSLFAFATETEEEKTYIVYPKETVSLFSADENSPKYMVIGEEELNYLLEEAPEMIDWYEENQEGTFFDVNIPFWYTNEGSLIRIRASAAWNQGYSGQNIKVGVIDSGIYNHKEFENRILDGYNFIDNNSDTTDTLGHGTMVAGVIAAANDGEGIDSIAPEVSIVPLKVDNADGKPELAAVIDAIYKAVDFYECDVINISLGVSSHSPGLEEAVKHATDRNIVVVAAVGNYVVDTADNTENKTVYKTDDTFSYPAKYDNVIGVGSIDWYDCSISPFSKKNDSVYLTAPGDFIVTTLNTGGYTHLGYGTSLAAPLVSGAVALLKQANSNLTPAEIMNILAESATDDVKGDGYDTAYGHGVLNVASAIELAQGNEVLAPSTVTYRVAAKDADLNGAITVENYTPGHIASLPLGASFTAEAEPTYKIDDGTEYKFAYWANGNGTHVSGKSTYTFNATSNFTLYAVYDKVTADGEEETEKKVEFWNGNGILLDTAKTDTEGKLASGDIPENPTMTGFSFTNNWLNEDESIFDIDAVLEKTLTRVVAQFTDGTADYSLTFDDNTDTDETKTGKYGEKVSYTATGDSFDYWELGGKPISYNPTIEIALWDTDATITAVYDKDDAKKIPTVVLDKGADGADFLIYSVPNGYTVVDAGIVFGTENSTPRVASFHSKASVKNLPENGFGQFTAQPGDVSHIVARGYLIYNDGTATRVIYADK